MTDFSEILVDQSARRAVIAEHLAHGELHDALSLARQDETASHDLVRWISERIAGNVTQGRNA